MERIGDRLRKKREELGFTIEDVARVIRFRPETIRAVEEGRVGVFPAEAYLKAFLRAYANTLGLDADEIVREQKSEEERIRDAIGAIKLRPRRNVNVRRTLLWLGVVVAIAIAVLVVFDRVFRDRYTPERMINGRGTGAGALRDSLSPGAASGSTQAGTVISREKPASDAVSPGDLSGTPPETKGKPTSDGGAPGSKPGGTSDRRAQRPDATSDGSETVIPAGSLSRLEVAVSGWPIRARLRSGDSVLVEGWLRPGYTDTFYCAGPFTVDYLTDRDAVSLKIDGKPVDLPTSKDKRISGFEIPSVQ